MAPSELYFLVFRPCVVFSGGLCLDLTRGMKQKAWPPGLTHPLDTIVLRAPYIFMAHNNVLTCFKIRRKKKNF